MSYRQTYGYTKEQKAVLFSVFMMIIVVSSLFLAALSYPGTIVLGTEKNTNGLVEYLCLGTGCDRLY